MSQENFKRDIPRVLIVENGLRWREDHQTNLNRWGYHPILAEGQGNLLQEDAIQKANQYRCHVALVDMRLLDHYDEDDNSGLLLVPMLKPTRSIIVTGYSSDHLVQSVLREQQADGVINKRRGSKALKQALDASLEKICAAKKGIKIKWQDGLSSEVIISSLLVKELSCEVPVDEVDDLLGLLFPTAKILNIRKLDHQDDRDVVMLDVYVDRQPEPKLVEMRKIIDSKEQRQIENRVSLWDLTAQLSS